MGLYAIVDLPHPFGMSAEAVTRAVLGDRLDGGTRGAAFVQLRAKEASTAERVDLLATMLPWCEQAKVPLVVNDDIEAALQSSPSIGVHLGQDDPGASDLLRLRARAALRGRLSTTIGLSTHTLPQLREAGRRGADYLAFGPVLTTTSKRNPDPVVGFEGLLQACRLSTAPLVAIGGLGAEEGRRAIEMGARYVAVIRGLVADSEQGVRERALHLSDTFAAAAEPLSLEEVHRFVPVFPIAQLREIARWSDDIGLHIEMGLPARFRPLVAGGEVRYRRCDVLDLLEALGKHPNETWEQWSLRTEQSKDDENVAPLVRLRRSR